MFFENLTAILHISAQTRDCYVTCKGEGWQGSFNCNRTVMSVITGAMQRQS